MLFVVIKPITFKPAEQLKTSSTNHTLLQKAKGFEDS